VDIITQGVIGAAAAQCGARPGRLRVAGLAGAVAGLLPDADIFIRLPSDPLLFLEYHRHFTHSLVFIPIGALIAALLSWLVTRRRESILALYWPSLLGIATHGVLDACTSYGTHLLWPFSDTRTAWHIISIVDPLFTLSLLVGVIWATKRHSRMAAVLGFAIAMAYLGLGVVQHQRVQSVHAALIAERGHMGVQPEAKPSIGNNFLYRAFYTHQGSYYVDAIRVPWFGESQVYPGEKIRVLDREGYVDRYALDALRQADIQRFSTFSGGYLVEDPRACGYLSDFRYAALPNAIAPLWGINVLGTPQGEHLEFRQWHDLSRNDQNRFMDMLLGR